MRTHAIIRLFLVLCIFNSCQKESENPNDTPASTTADFRAKISEVQFIASISGAARRSESVISIAGKYDDGQQIVFTVADSGVHVYQLAFNKFQTLVRM